MNGLDESMQNVGVNKNISIILNMFETILAIIANILNAQLSPLP